MNRVKSLVRFYKSKKVKALCERFARISKFASLLISSPKFAAF